MPSVVVELKKPFHSQSQSSVFFPDHHACRSTHNTAYSILIYRPRPRTDSLTWVYRLYTQHKYKPFINTV
jgi:hypothetical protein